jgi:hypothetical protein
MPADKMFIVWCAAVAVITIGLGLLGNHCLNRQSTYYWTNRRKWTDPTHT